MEPSRSADSKVFPNLVREWQKAPCYRNEEPGERSLSIDWVRLSPFIAIHLGCFGIVWVGWSPLAVLIAIALYALRMFAITAFYHRYFSHRAFQTSRMFRFVMALLGNSAAQRGPLWWASHHRHHHQHSDSSEDAHSPGRHGFLTSHMGWFMMRANGDTKTAYVKDWSRVPELRLIERYSSVVPVLLALTLLGLGMFLESVYPHFGVDGAQLLVWGFCVSTVFCYHATYTINSLSHVLGTRRYPTQDQSRNNWFLALLTFGEGWHNNHHYYPKSARQGFLWWEVDLTYWGLLILERLGLVWDLKPVPESIRNAKSSIGGRP